MSSTTTNARVAALAFAAFAVLIALRDVSFELFLQEKPVAFAFLVCATIATLAVVIVTLQRGWSALLSKLCEKGALPRAVLLSLLSGAIYGGGFYLVSLMGAGTFHTINYGLMPVAAAVVGASLFGGTIPRTFWLAFCTYLVGLGLLMAETEELRSWAYAGVAMIVPVVTAVCDGLTKWLLNKDRPKHLKPSEALAVRFVPATAALGIYAAVAGHSVTIENVAPALTVAVLFGFVPLGLLCIGLVKASMQTYAPWLFLIPAIAFFGTLHAHPESVRPLPIAGAVLMMVGVVVCVLLGRRSPPGAQRPQGTSRAAPVVLQPMPPKSPESGRVPQDAMKQE